MTTNNKSKALAKISEKSINDIINEKYLEIGMGIFIFLVFKKVFFDIILSF